MNPKDTFTLNNGFVINTDLLPERFSVIGAIQVRNNDYVVMGRENDSTIPEDNSYCSWLYNPECGFFYGHYRLTRDEAFKELLSRG